jgi:hypothetical protein
MSHNVQLIALSFLLAMAPACSDSVEGTETADVGLSFPTQDVQPSTDTAGLDTALEDLASPDATTSDTGSNPLPVDAGTQEDTVAVVDAVTGEDVAVADQTAQEDAALADLAVEDAAEPDTGPALDVGDECVPPIPGECDPEGLWTVTLVSSAAPGQGCGDNGGPGQAESTHTIQVTSTGNGLYKVKMLDPSDGDIISSLQIVGGPNVCKIAFSTTVSVNVPGAGDIEGGTAALVYAYTLTQTNNTFAGPGAVTTSFVTVSGEVIAECTEPLSAKGTLAP